MLTKEDYINILNRWIEMYNDPYPVEHNGRGNVRDAAWKFLNDADASLLEAIYTCGASLHNWIAAAQMGWSVVLGPNGETYVKPDGVKPSLADWDAAYAAMSQHNAYYWR